MLRALEIRNMLIIDRLDLVFQPGLNVLTGETGAGKSILLDCLGFVLGWRGQADLVRHGENTGEVTAVFDLPRGHPAHGVLDEAGFAASEELILRRVNSSDGRKTSWINDRRATGEVLRALSDTLVELHGQHDDRGLLNPRGHRSLLDDFAGTAPLMAEVRAAWRARFAAQKALDAATARLAEVRAEEEFLRHSVAELDLLAPLAGEEASLDSERRLMQAAEKIRNDVDRASLALGYEGAEGLLSQAMRWLEGAADRAEGRLDAPLAALDRALIELTDAQSGVESCLDALAFNPADLETAEERLFAIRALARKHSVPPDELGPFADDLRARLAELDGGETEVKTLAGAVSAAKDTYDRAAEALTSARAAAARRLDAAMGAELEPLKMERAVFTTVLSSAEAGPDGADDVQFMVATNPGAPAGALNKIASGGELSRFLLALKVCLTQGNAGLTLIFDEIDRGVGGATADAVGRRLAALAGAGQVLVVTHSPQVAALGAHHWRVEKHQSEDETLTTVVALKADERVSEIARMLSGDRITDAARAAAVALLKA